RASRPDLAHAPQLRACRDPCAIYAGSHRRRARAPTLRRIIGDDYEHLSRGRLEATGRLFENAVKVYVYPTIDPASGALVAAEALVVAEAMRYLYASLPENRDVEGLESYDPASLQIETRDVVARLQRGAAGWESAVPERVAAIIKERRLFGSMRRRGG